MGTCPWNTCKARGIGGFGEGGAQLGERDWVYPEQKNRLVTVLHQMFLVGYKGENTEVEVPRVSTGSDIQELIKLPN